MASKKRSKPLLSKEERLDLEATVREYLDERALEEASKISEKANHKLAVFATREQVFLDRFNSVAENVFRDVISVPKYKAAKRKLPSRHLNLLLSDLHLHSMLGKGLPTAYGAKEEARALSNVVIQTVEYKTQYRDDTILNLHLCGDIIQGTMHDGPEARLAEQVAAAMHLLIQAVGFLASNFREVKVRCTPGNHGRNQSRHVMRAIHDKWDSIENMVYYGLKKGVAHVPNVTVEIPYEPYFTYDSFGAKCMGTHGDTVINPGNPGSNVDVSGIRRQTNEWNSKLQADERFQLFFVGHVHTASQVVLPSGVRFITNGCLVPPDGYSISAGFYTTTCGQWLWESVPNYVVGDSRFITINEATYKDAGLNVIQPFEAF